MAARLRALAPRLPVEVAFADDKLPFLSIDLHDPVITITPQSRLASRFGVTFHDCHGYVTTHKNLSANQVVDLIKPYMR